MYLQVLIFSTPEKLKKKKVNWLERYQSAKEDCFRNTVENQMTSNKGAAASIGLSRKKCGRSRKPRVGHPGWRKSCRMLGKKLLVREKLEKRKKI